MRRVGHELGVEAMSLYNHIANKEDLLDGMLDVVVVEIDPPLEDEGDWRRVFHERALSARRALLAPSVGVGGDRQPNQSHAGDARLHGLDDRHRPTRRVLARPDPPRDACPGQPVNGLRPGAVRRLGRL